MTNEQMAARLEEVAKVARQHYDSEKDVKVMEAGAAALREVERLRGLVTDIYGIVCEELAEPPSGTGPLVRIGTLIEEKGGDTALPRETGPLPEPEQPWTARERRLHAALETIPVDLINAIENGEAPAKIFLSAGSCKMIAAALADTPPTDPRDAALEKAEKALEAVVMRSSVSQLRAQCKSALAAIRAAREGK